MTPVMAQTTTVSQNVPEEETSGRRTGFLSGPRRRGGGATQARLVGKQAPGDAETHRLAHPGPQEAAHGRLAGERALDDQPQRVR